ncbi:MAG: YkgJ family cysteine cluster protein [Desulfosudaceae bacterium]
MDFDFTPYFAKYEALVHIVDGVFDRVKKDYPACVNCKKGCTDCCYALFDLTLIEALYLNHKFQERFGADPEMKEKANKADRQIYKLKRQAHKDYSEKGKNEVAILQEMGLSRIRCPLLGERELCDLYEYRPITCRLYGIPISIQGMAHTCGKSGFDPGEKYPTVNMDEIYNQLYQLSAELVADIKTRYVKMDEMLVPLSMAIITEYDDVFFGFTNDPEETEGKDTDKG